MSAHALRTADPAVGRRLLGNLDLVILAVALAIFLVAGLPLAGWAIATTVWLVQRGVQALVDRRAAAASDPQTIAGWTAGGFIGRAMLTVIGIFAGGLLAGDDAGLAAVLLVLLVFTVYFLTRQLQRGLAPR
jgi:uncharacterized SAM-binding protein YcdF (DUF218 family)